MAQGCPESFVNNYALQRDFGAHASMEMHSHNSVVAQVVLGPVHLSKEASKDSLK